MLLKTGDKVMTLEETMSMPMGERTIGANLALAVADGKLLKKENGDWQLPPSKEVISPWLRGGCTHNIPCQFYQQVMFSIVYQKQHVPFGCRDCYKVVLTPRTLRELVNVHDLAQQIPFTFKCGLSQNIEGTSSVYNAYFYAIGLEEARSIFHQVRTLVDNYQGLGKELRMVIKRGCTNYELQCGPSSLYQFSPEQEGIEACLKHHAWDNRQDDSQTQGMMQRLQQTAATRLLWIRTAFSIGDETYLDFTDGQRLYPATETYSPDQD